MADLIDRLRIRNKLYDADAITMRGVAMLNQEPEVDAVPVVRCKDCKYYQGNNGVDCGFFDGLVTVMEDDFCSYGMKRSEYEV